MRGRLRARTLLRISIVLSVTLLAGLVGALTAQSTAGQGLWSRAITSALLGMSLTVLELTLQGPGASALRRLPILPVFLLRVGVYGAMFVALTQATSIVLGWNALGRSAPAIGLDERLRGDVAMMVSLSLGFNLWFVLRRLLGPGTLIALITGRYHRPRQECRIVLFVDLVGSTALAERLGDVAFHRFVNRVLFDITDPVLEAGGEIYRYVGDEVIVTWPFARGIRDAACVRCVFAINAVLARRRGDYERQFGAAPRLRSALHAGNLIVGEMGDGKREIVMLGDTMNTTARIEDACRSSGHDVIASGEVIHALSSLPNGVRAESLGIMELRGRAAALELFALLA